MRTKEAEQDAVIEPIDLAALAMIEGGAGKAGLFTKLYTGWKFLVLAVAPPLEMPPAIVSRVASPAIHRQFTTH